MQGENVGPQGTSLKLQNDEPVPSTVPIQEYLHCDKLKNVKKFVRKEKLTAGFPARNSLWNSICDYHAKTQHSDSFYTNLIKKENTEALQSLPDFVDPILVDDYWLSQRGRDRVFLILNAIAISHTHLLYAPLLYPTTAILLHYMPHTEVYNTSLSQRTKIAKINAQQTLLEMIDSINETLEYGYAFSCVRQHDVGRLMKSYWVLPCVDRSRAICCILDDNKVHHIDQTPNAYCRSSILLQRLTKKLSPKTYKWVLKSLSSKNDEVSHFFLTWPLWIFRALPVPYLVRLFDNFLLDGARALYRSCILVLSLYSQYGTTGSDIQTPTDLTGRSNGVNVFQRSSPRRRSLSSRLRRSLRNSFRATPKVQRKFEAAETMLDGLIVFVRANLPSILTEPQLIAKAYAIRGLSRRVMGQLAECDMQELCKMSTHLPIKITSKEILIKQVNLNAVDASILYYLSELKSSIASRAQLELIWAHLPSRFTVVKPYVIFTSVDHGTSLRNFLHMVDDVEPLLILVKTRDGEILGAYCSTAWGERNKGRKFFGTGETFVFNFGNSGILEVYKWVGYGASSDTELSAGQQLFQCAIDGIDIGCGSLHICPDMNIGRSDTSTTFGNKPLSQNKEFAILELEAIAFE